MRIPDPKTIDVDALIAALRGATAVMVRTDGDRDHMNTSHLTCGSIQRAAELMEIAAAKLESLRPTDPFQGQAS